MFESHQPAKPSPLAFGFKKNLALATISDSQNRTPYRIRLHYPRQGSSALRQVCLPERTYIPKQGRELKRFSPGSLRQVRCLRSLRTHAAQVFVAARQIGRRNFRCNLLGFEPWATVLSRHTGLIHRMCGAHGGQFNGINRQGKNRHLRQHGYDQQAGNPRSHFWGCRSHRRQSASISAAKM